MMAEDFVPGTKIVSDAGHEHQVPCILPTLHSCINICISLHCVTVSAWVMHQPCVQLDQQPPSLLAVAVDCVSVCFRL